MSRRRQFDEPVVHGYWTHSDPEPPTNVVSAPAAPIPPAPAEDPCPGPCNREVRAAELEHQGNHDVPFHPGRPVWCKDATHVDEHHNVIVDHHGCTERITADLRALPDLATHLGPGALNTPRDIRADGRGMGSTTLVHPPTNSPGWDTADELIRWAIHLEDELRARLGHDDRTRAKRRDLGSAVRYLATYSTALLSGLDAEKVGRQIMGRKRDLEQRTGRDRLIHRLPGTCLVCDRKGLQRRDGGDLVRCRSCGATWAWEQYELLARAYADDVRRRGA